MKIKILLSLLIILILCTSCTPRQNGSNTEPPSTSTEADPFTEAVGDSQSRSITLYEDGKWLCKITTRAERSIGEGEFSNGLKTACAALTSSVPRTGSDSSLQDEQTPEIIVGYTAHEQMQSLYSMLSYGQAVIRTVGCKIYVAAYSSEGYKALLEHFCALLEKGYSNGTVSFDADDLKATLTTDEAADKIPTPYDLPFVDVYNCGLGQTMTVHSGASVEAFDKYIQRFDAGTCVSSVYESGNAFATFDLGDDLVNVSFAKNDKLLRIIRNKSTEPTSLFEKPAEIKKVCEPLLIMHGLGWNEDRPNGMCFIIRLSDGRFIVIDGGFNRQRDADELYALLKGNTPDGMDTVIAAWFITHAHSDHHGNFATAFCAHYKNKVKVESVMFNPPENKLFTGTPNDSPATGTSSRITVMNAIKAYKAHHVRSHVGDRYYIGDAVVDVLFAIDYQYPSQFAYYNTCSLIFSINIAGQKIMITGDGSNDSFKRAVAMYGESLKADIVQVAHHGYSTGVSSAASTSVMQGYKYMSPSLVLWPVSAESYKDIKNEVYNLTLKNLPTVKKVLIAEDKDYVISLPFNG